MLLLPLSLFRGSSPAPGLLLNSSCVSLPHKRRVSEQWVYSPQRTGMGTLSHAFGTCLTEDYVSGGCRAGVRKQFHINKKSDFFSFANSIHLVTLILLAQLSSIFINSFVPSNNSLLWPILTPDSACRGGKTQDLEEMFVSWANQFSLNRTGRK